MAQIASSGDHLLMPPATQAAYAQARALNLFCKKVRFGPR